MWVPKYNSSEMWVPKYNSSEMWVPLKDTIKNKLLLQTILVEIQCHEMFGTPKVVTVAE